MSSLNSQALTAADIEATLAKNIKSNFVIRSKHMAEVVEIMECCWEIK